MSQVWDTESESHTEKLVLLALADNSNDEGYCWPSIATIARKCDLSERSVRSQLRLLEVKRWVQTTQRLGHSSTYRISLPTPERRAGRNGVPPEPSVEPPKEPSRDLGLPSEVQKPWNPSEVQIRLGKLFKRKPTTRWSHSEIKSFRLIGGIEDGDLLILERYYTARIPEPSDYRRRDLSTLLNNFTGELDRARNFKAPTCF